MSDISCVECQELGVEFALNTMRGETRGRVVDHLNHCPRCRATITALTETSERLMELMPETVPPLGFQQRVLTAVAHHAPETRHGAVLVAAVLVVIALLCGAGLLGQQVTKPGSDHDRQPGTRTLLYSPLTGEHAQLGQVYLYPDEHAWMYLSTPTGKGPMTVRCAALKTDDDTMLLGTYPLINGSGGWQLRTSVPPGAVVVATVYDVHGNTVATAQFPPAQAD